ncbi:MAG: hypothetical protein QXJ97_13750 [Desulfurococcaceae archaeon]
MSRMKKAALTLGLTVLALLALAQVTYPLVITTVETKDYLGYPRTSFRRGEIVIIETMIEVAPAYYYYYIAPIDYLEIITMWYGNTMMGLLLTRTSIALGETKTFGGGVGIRLTDPIGTYRIEVYVWNGFPSEMGADWRPLAEAKTTTITVTG